MKLRLTALAAGVVMLFSSCGILSDSGDDMASNSKEIVSSNYKYKVDVPTDWEELKPGDEGYASELFMQAACYKRSMYFGASIAEDQASFFGIDNFCNMMARELKKTYVFNFQDIKFEDVTINGVDLKFFEAKNVSEDDNGDGNERIWCYIRQVDDDYIGFVVSTFEDKDTDNKKEEADMIISSYGKFVY